MIWADILKISEFFVKIFIFWRRFSVYLNRHVFVMYQWIFWSNYANAQADMNLHSAHMFVGMFSDIITKTCLFKYTENFTSKNLKFSDKNLWYFSYFCSKHRLWALVRTDGSNEYPQPMVLSKNKKNNVYPGKPQFYYIKVRFKGVKII